MSLIKRWTIALWLICIFLSVPSYADNPDSLYQLAGEYYGNNNYRKGILAYERCIFYSSSSDQKAEALIGKSRCQKALNRYKDALTTLMRLKTDKADDTIITDLYYERGLLYVLDGNFEKAWQTINDIKYRVDDTTLLTKFEPLKIITAHRLEMWDEGKRLLQQYLSEHNIDTTGTDTLYLSLAGMKDPKKAIRLSMFLPGAGQMYAGSVKNGLINIIIQSGMVLFMIYCIGNQMYITAIMAGFQNVSRFYMGGARNAAFLARSKNDKITEEINTSIKRIVIEIENSMMK